MGVFHTHYLLLTGNHRSGSNVSVPTFLVTAEDREWFARCRRAWDLGARARQDLETRTVADAAAKRRRSICDALAVYYFPGMWTWNRSIVDPLVQAAIERGGGGPEEHALINAYAQWAPSFDSFTPLWVEPDVEVNVPDPDRPEFDLATSDGAVVKYRERPSMLVSEDGDVREYWLFQHRVVDRFAEPDELLLDERGILACWAWGQFHLAQPIEGTFYNEVIQDPVSFRRTRIHRPRTEQAAAAARLGRAIKEMLDPALAVDPTPEWSHCSRCSFRSPCMATNRGHDAARLLAEGYEKRPPDVVEEGRLGGAAWGLGRGTAFHFKSDRR